MSDVESLPNGKHIYGVGTRAFYDTAYSGLVPCIVTAIVPGIHSGTVTGFHEISITVTSTKGAYPKGFNTVCGPAQVIPSRHVIKRNGLNYINTSFHWRGENSQS